MTLYEKFKELVKTIAYDKTETDTKLNTKADTTLASTTNNGLMSSADKVKLDGLSADSGGGSASITVDSALSSTSENPVQNKVIKEALDDKADKTLASTTADGLMSSADKTKLDGLSADSGGGSASITVDSALSGTSVNLVQNKVIKSALDGKANSSHSHSISNVSNLQSSLNGKANSSHSHSISDVSNLQSNLNDKAAPNHTHSGYASSSHSHPVDSSLSSSSTNPVQNKAVYSAIGDIKSALNSILGS